MINGTATSGVIPAILYYNKVKRVYNHVRCTNCLISLTFLTCIFVVVVLNRFSFILSQFSPKMDLREK